MELYSDTYYIKRILSGDEQSFACLLDKYSQRVFSLVCRIVDNKEDAEELTQDIFVKAFNKLDSFNGDSQFSTWLYRIAYNTAISAMRRHKEPCLSIDENILGDEEIEISDMLEQSDDVRLKLLNRALSQISAEERAILILFYKEEKSIEEISAITKNTVGNTKVKLHRIRKKLMVIIKKLENEL